MKTAPWSSKKRRFGCFGGDVRARSSCMHHSCPLLDAAAVSAQDKALGALRCCTRALSPSKPTVGV